jgi:hypothetical protein
MLDTISLEEHRKASAQHGSSCGCGAQRRYPDTVFPGTRSLQSLSMDACPQIVNEAMRSFEKTYGCSSRAYKPVRLLRRLRIAERR